MVEQMMYIVRFIRKDRKPNEEYYYLEEEDSRYHFLLFTDDNSGLYNEIQLISSNGVESQIVDILVFI